MGANGSSCEIAMLFFTHDGVSKPALPPPGQGSDSTLRKGRPGSREMRQGRNYQEEHLYTALQPLKAAVSRLYHPLNKVCGRSTICLALVLRGIGLYLPSLVSAV